jgi:hypothetical protein
MFVYALALVSGVVTIVAYVELDDSTISIPEIRVQVLESVEASYRRQKTVAEAIVGDWQERERQLEVTVKQCGVQFQRIASGADADRVACKSKVRLGTWEQRMRFGCRSGSKTCDCRFRSRCRSRSWRILTGSCPLGIHRQCVYPCSTRRRMSQQGRKPTVCIQVQR